MQNKANLLDTQMNVTIVLTEYYENERLCIRGEKQTQSNPIANQPPHFQNFSQKLPLFQFFNYFITLFLCLPSSSLQYRASLALRRTSRRTSETASAVCEKCRLSSYLLVECKSKQKQKQETKMEDCLRFLPGFLKMSSPDNAYCPFSYQPAKQQSCLCTLPSLKSTQRERDVLPASVIRIVACRDRGHHSPHPRPAHLVCRDRRQSLGVCRRRRHAALPSALPR